MNGSPALRGGLGGEKPADVITYAYGAQAVIVLSAGLGMASPVD